MLAGSCARTAVSWCYVDHRWGPTRKTKQVFLKNGLGLSPPPPPTPFFFFFFFCGSTNAGLCYAQSEVGLESLGFRSRFEGRLCSNFRQLSQALIAQMINQTLFLSFSRHSLSPKLHQTCASHCCSQGIAGCARPTICNSAPRKTASYFHILGRF